MDANEIVPSEVQEKSFHLKWNLPPTKPNLSSFLKVNEQKKNNAKPTSSELNLKLP